MLLYLTKKITPNPMGGREMLSKLNHDALSEVLGDQYVVFELPFKKLTSFLELLNALRGYFDGLSENAIEHVFEIIRQRDVRKVFIDGSNLGAFVPKLKRIFPEVEVITYYHNVEARFFWGSFLANKSFRAFGILLVNYLAERSATRLSDKRVCLHERDSHKLLRLYGRGATHISGIALVDKYSEHRAERSILDEEHFALFVGGNFYANRDGIVWFVKHVVPRIDIKVCILGKGMESLRSELEIPGKVEVVGPVESLSEWYRSAHFVIAPIFDGSGMKTKIAEAMMFGKKVVGTPEAFCGYELAADAGWVCRTADDFVMAIAAAEREIDSAFYQDLRSTFLSCHSFKAAKERLKEILK